ncbi:MAG TPA: DUF4236 domain-containing protein [Rhizomicrobium sp.]|jgi:hypothetical protein
MGFLKGLRFQKRVSVLPGVRVNLSKSGASASLGPRGADVNISTHGVTTNAGIPGTGLSYRQKVGKGRGLLGVLAVVAGLGVWAFQHVDKISKAIAPVREGTATTAAFPTGSSTDMSTASENIRFVHRGGSILRDKPKTYGQLLKKEMKGARVVLLSESNGWAKVTDANITGYMRASVLGAAPPQ